MSVLEIRNLTKSYGKNTVVKDISLSVEDGEFMVILGPSGGGKSTFLRLICGLENPDSGEVLINGRDVTKLPPRERNLGMVFQDYGLYPNMNTYQNISYGLEARGMGRQEVEQRVTAAARKLNLTDYLDRNINDLSGGEQQRVALARALAKDADVFLYDEPLSNLDPKLRSSARRDIISVHREKKKPSVYVTHDQSEALAIADRIAIIAGGRLMQVGQADDFLNSPANIFVASFIGTPAMNILPGKLAYASEHYRVDAVGINIILPDRWKPTLDRYGKDHIMLGIRPSALLPAAQAGAYKMTPWKMIAGTIDNIVPLVGESIITLKIGQDTFLAVVLPESDIQFEIGQNIQMVLDPDTICLFDPDSEQALVA